MNLLGRSIIGNERGRDGAQFRAVNPATGESLEPAFVSASARDIERAAALAADAFAKNLHRSGKDRGALLRQIAANLESAGEALVERANLETALPLARLQGELARTTGQLRMFAALVEEGSWVDARIDRADPDRKPAPKPDLRSMLRPSGPVAVFGASNFPLAFSTAGGDTASALAAGCPVIVKAHPAHPGTSEIAGLAIVNAVRETGFAEGTFSLLFDGGIDVGVALVSHPAVKAVGFTGSRRGGMALMEIAAKRPEPIPVFAEMGSVNPVFVLPRAMASRAASIAAGLHASVTLGVGQFCTNPGLVIIEKSEASREFIGELEAKMSGTAAGTMLTAGISRTYRSSVEKLGGVAGVERRVSIEALGDHGAGAALFVTDAPTFLGRPELMEEVFGPSTVVVQGSSDRLLDIARSLEGQLTVTLQVEGDDLAKHRELIDVLESKAGRLIVNGFPTGVEVAPAMVHGGPFPATSDGRSTSVGTRAIERFVRPVCYQGFPDEALPEELREANPLGIRRLVDGVPR